MARLKDDPDTLNALVATTADALGIDAAFVEKDFWVIEVLRAATKDVVVVDKDGQCHPVTAIFKGGTSLSRVYGLIERFSEDVDLLAAFPDADLSIGARDRVLKRLRCPQVTPGEPIRQRPREPAGGWSKAVRKLGPKQYSLTV